MKKYRIDLIIIIVSYIIAFIIYPMLPAQIPYHFGVRGTQYCAKEFIFLMALLPEVASRGIRMKYSRKG
jgi:uncharacterized membrane protein